MKTDRNVLLGVITGRDQREFTKFNADRAAHLSIDDSAQQLLSASNTDGFARMTLPKSTGKWFVEFVVDTRSTGILAVRIGLATPSANVNVRLGSAAGGVGFDEGGLVYPALNSIGGYFVLGRVVVGMAWNADTGDVWWSVDGDWLGGVPSQGLNPHATGVTGLHHIAVGIHRIANVTIRQPRSRTGAEVASDESRVTPLSGFNQGWYVDAGPTYLIGTEDFVSWPDDPAPYENRLFDGVITLDPDSDRTLQTRVWDGAGSRRNAVSRVDLANESGALNSWLPLNWRDYLLRLYLGRAGDAFRNFELVSESVIDRLDITDPTRPKLLCVDRAADLARPVQTNVFSAILPVVELRGQTQPVTIGRCDYVPIERVDTVLQYFTAHDGAAHDFIELLDAGVVITESVGWQSAAGDTLIERLTNPNAKQVMTLAGAKDVRGGLVERMPSVVSWLLSRANAIGAINLASCQDLDELLPHPIGLHFPLGGSATVRDALEQILDSFLAGIWTDRNGQLHLVGLREPSVTADFTVSDGELLTDVRRTFDAAKGLSDKVRCRRNYGVHNDSDIAAAVAPTALADRLKQEWLVTCTGTGTLHPAYASAVGAPPLESVFSSEAGGQALADRMTSLYSQMRYFYAADAWIDRAYEIEIGSTVYLERENKNLLVVGARPRFMTNAVTLKLWG